MLSLQTQTNFCVEFKKCRVIQIPCGEGCNPDKMVKALWSDRKDLSHLKAIQWGKEKEYEARMDYEAKTGYKVTCCGIFISKNKVENPHNGPSAILA